ncbi:hypothetical protein EDD92_2354 [Streptomyces sp. TLI_185]|nr:hypothetical protein EDD92_2354 [Streptomyces sp. TLI_185]
MSNEWRKLYEPATTAPAASTAPSGSAAGVPRVPRVAHVCGGSGLVGAGIWLCGLPLAGGSRRGRWRLIGPVRLSGAPRVPRVALVCRRGLSSGPVYSAERLPPDGGSLGVGQGSPDGSSGRRLLPPREPRPRGHSADISERPPHVGQLGSARGRCVRLSASLRPAGGLRGGHDCTGRFGRIHRTGSRRVPLARAVPDGPVASGGAVYPALRSPAGRRESSRSIPAASAVAASGTRAGRPVSAPAGACGSAVVPRPPRRRWWGRWGRALVRTGLRPVPASGPRCPGRRAAHRADHRRCAIHVAVAGSGRW